MKFLSAAALSFLLLGSLTSTTAAAVGDADALNASIVGDKVYSTVQQPDGKLIIAGSFTSVLGVARNNIARLNADGTLDTGFDPNADAAVRCVVLQPDGKILLGGEFTQLQPNGTPTSINSGYIARLNADGTQDLSFDVYSSDVVYSIALRPDGKMWVGGDFTYIANVNRGRLIRLKADGTNDSTFPLTNVGGTVYSLAVQSDGRLVLGGTFSSVGGVVAANVARINLDERLDVTFRPTPNGGVYSIVSQPDDKVLLGGDFTSLLPPGATTDIPRSHVARVNLDGQVDAGFNPGADGSVTTLALQADGKVLLGGAFATVGGAARSFIARVTGAGVVDATFDPHPNGTVSSVALQLDGSVLVGGQFTGLQGSGGTLSSRSCLARLSNDAATQSLLVSSASSVFWARGGACPEVSAVSLQLSVDGGATWTSLGAGGPVMGGRSFADLSLPAAGLLRAQGFTHGGAGSSSRGYVVQSAAFSGVAPVAVDIVVQGNGSTIINGSTLPTLAAQTDFGSTPVAGANTVVRTFTIRNSGTAALTLTGAPRVVLSGPHAADFSVTAQPAASVAGGGSTTFQITFDPSAQGVRSAWVSIASNDPDENPHVFAIQGWGAATGDPDALNVPVTGTIYSVTPQPDGKVILAGSFTMVLGVARNSMARLNADGTLDTAFNPNVNSQVNAVVVQPDGRILLGGFFTQLNPNGSGAVGRSYMARLNADGTVDTSFVPPSFNANVSCMVLQKDGKIIVGGAFYPGYNNDPPGYGRFLVRLDANGGVDQSFSAAVLNNYSVSYMELQPDGKVLMTSRFMAVNGGADVLTARLNPDGTVDSSFNPGVAGTVSGMRLQPDGKILLYGNFSSVGGLPRTGMARINADSSVDAGFNPKPNIADIRSMALQADGKVIVTGGFTSFQPNGAASATQRLGIARVNADGTLDEGFQTGVTGSVNAVTLEPDGHILLGGSFTSLFSTGGNRTARASFARLLNDPAAQTLSLVDRYTLSWARSGSVEEVSDVTFDVSTDGGTTWTPVGSGTRAAGGWTCATNMKLPTSGRVRARGRSRGAYTGNGSGLTWQVLDYSLPAEPLDIVVQGNGVRLRGGSQAPAAASNTDFGSAVAAGNAKASRSFTLGVEGSQTLILNGTPQVALSGTNAADFTVTAQPAAQVSAGQSTTFQITFDPSAAGLRTATVSIASNDPDENPFTFTIQGRGLDVSEVDPQNLNIIGSAVNATAQQADGKLLIVGQFSSVQGVTRNNIARLNADGTLDMGFNPNVNGQAYSVAVQADGKILLGGTFNQVQPNGAASPTACGYAIRLNADGTLDAAYSPNPTNPVYGIALQPDGKALLCGTFAALYPNGASTPTYRNYVVRVNVDGTVDDSFVASPSSTVYSVALQPDGKVIVGGSFTGMGALIRGRVARVNADGSPDASFNPPTVGDYVSRVVVQPDGKVLVAGTFSEVYVEAVQVIRKGIARLNADGALDFSFNPNPNAVVSALALQADGKILLGGNFTTLQPEGAATATTCNHVARVNADGTLDATFSGGVSAQVYTVAPLPDGSLLLGGIFASVFPPAGGSVTQGMFARLFNGSASQSLSLVGGNSLSWTRGGSAPEVDSVVFDLSADLGSTWTPLGTGARVAGGWQLTGLSFPSAGLVRARGRTAGGFYAGSSLIAQQVAFGTQPAAVMAVQGRGTTIAPDDATPGKADDTDFGPSLAGGSGSVVRTFTIRNTGTLDLALTGTPRVALTGLNTADFTVTTQPAASVPVGGSTTFQIAFAPFAAGQRTVTVSVASSDGVRNPYVFAIQGRGGIPAETDALDLGMAGSFVLATAEQPDGKLIIAGSFSTVLGVARNNIARLNADGTLDAGFNPNVNGTIYSVVLQPDGQVLLGGLFTALQPNGAAAPTQRIRMARVHADGTLDAVFDPNVRGDVYCLALQGDGKILAGGALTEFYPNGSTTPQYHNYIARLNADGTLDASYVPAASNAVKSIVLQPDGKALVAGNFAAMNSAARLYVARLNTDGTLDTGFDAVANDFVNTVALQADGKVLLGGQFTTVGGAARNRIARVNADGTPDASFNPNASGDVFSVAVQADGKVLLGGQFTSVGGTVRNRIARLNADGTLDAAFDAGADGIVRSVVLRADGGVMLGGEFQNLATDAGSVAARGLFARLFNGPAVRTLGQLGSNGVAWMSSGTAPDLAAVTFELSVDSGVTWSPLGTAARVAGGWQSAGLSLPGAGMVRARGRVQGGFYGGSGGLIAQTLALAPSSDARLAGLTVSGATLTPAFASNTLSYAATVPNGSSSLAFTATKADAGATVGGNASPKSLAVGNNTLSVTVTAQDGVTQLTYSVTVYRQTAAETAVSTWAAGFGVPAASQGLLDDPDHDGGTNLQEFAFGTGPLAAGQGALVYNGSLDGGGTLQRGGQPVVMSQTTGGVTQWHAVFVRRTDQAAAGITYSASFSGNLSTWETSVATPVVLADDGTYQVVRVPFPALVGGDVARFFRVTVNTAP